MTRKNLITLTVAFAAVLAVCLISQHKPTPKEVPRTIEEPPQTDDLSAPPPLEPIEPIHEEGYIRYEITDDERAVVERVVAAESRNQHLNGQIAVAQCVLNTAEAETMRPDEVVLQPNQYAPPAPPELVTDSVKQAVSAVFDYGITITDEPIRYFYAPKFSPGTWHEANLEHVITIQDHKFFKIKGA